MGLRTRASSTLRNVDVMLLLLAWCAVFWFHQTYIPRKVIEQCSFHQSNSTTFTVLMIADPQLIDNHTYPGRNKILLGLSKHTVDTYLTRNFRHLISTLHPDSVMFVGDLMDNGRSSEDNYYEREYSRFKNIFPDSDSYEMLTNVPGNHDVGWANGVKKHAVGRFNMHFGESNTVITRGNHEFIFLDSLSLSNTNDESIYGPSSRFMQEFKNRRKDKPRILLTHVPLFRNPDIDCGPMREGGKFPLTQGYQYQTVLDNELSEEILASFKPDLILTGDDHDYCEYNHEYHVNETSYIAKEITVKSISMAMGIQRPAVELLTLQNEKLYFSICHLERPYREVITYVLLAALTVVIIFFWNNTHIRGRRYQPLANRSIRNKLANYVKGIEVDNFGPATTILVGQADQETPASNNFATSWWNLKHHTRAPIGSSLFTKLNFGVFIKKCAIMSLCVAILYINMVGI
ncbi:Putative mannose-ethanolamine phosphate phosphodiesterase [Komagataella phaffii CBS 7435]|uniref:Calcineurin-like phosphoesterase domain-containing protein n=2 Tax=Komagataella phaffii TaxID=460519 RepID=C4R4I6_KOMPG|nr:Putative membrane protein of unknown function involved in Mn2+ homeostasis [Komagataella phaffii GS115]AOA63471.1 GQ67_03492T0 [Komagataella phaffii]CAH2449773.1 Putative mannose-ethanolamine phosphate phosphodiesterase [Komagataella phaffii CBS 7435]AOA68816.1 GQ68_03462T0 [Komagataella phaffii GS115]CAY70472.1 Putative membrane protein of unknown function involved in Mn2+ homeostasis [Komagataella phaffii GS115]SCV12251.1 Putative mannose-ethanolamine phosphate phosphodiesterase [Komagata